MTGHRSKLQNSKLYKPLKIPKLKREMKKKIKPTSDNLVTTRTEVDEVDEVVNLQKQKNTTMPICHFMTGHRSKLQNSKPLQTLKIPKLKREMKKKLNQPLIISSPPGPKLMKLMKL